MKSWILSILFRSPIGDSLFLSGWLYGLAALCIGEKNQQVHNLLLLNRWVRTVEHNNNIVALTHLTKGQRERERNNFSIKFIELNVCAFSEMHLWP